MIEKYGISKNQALLAGGSVDYVIKYFIPSEGILMFFGTFDFQASNLAGINDQQKRLIGGYYNPGVGPFPAINQDFPIASALSGNVTFALLQDQNRLIARISIINVDYDILVHGDLYVGRGGDAAGPPP